MARRRKQEWTFFAVRKVGTDKWIPYHYRGGTTHLTPIDDRTPELFTNIGAANKFINDWLKGVYIGNGLYSYVEGRLRSDLEIVQMIVKPTSITVQP